MKFFQKRKKKNILPKREKGDEKAFIKLYDQYAPQIYRFIYLKTNSCEDSEDLASEVFLRLWKHWGQPPKTGAAPSNAPNNPRALLYQIARNLVIDYYRKKPRADLIIDEEKEKIFENMPSREADLGEKMAIESDLVQIRKAIAKIKPDYQDLILWRYLDDFSVKEIAQVLERPQSTVRVQLHRALESLRKELK